MHDISRENENIMYTIYIVFNTLIIFCSSENAISLNRLILKLSLCFLIISDKQEGCHMDHLQPASVERIKVISSWK